MITRKELSYVSSYANRVPYPGTSYAIRALENLKEAIENFNKYYNNKQYEIVLSNGEQISFEILSRNLCHLLGIDFKSIISPNYSNYRKDVLKTDAITNSYELLERIVNNMDDVLNYDNKNEERLINYYRVMVKCAIFDAISNFSNFDFGVINFNKAVYENITNRPMNCNSTKYLYVQSNEPSAPYFMTGILINGNNNYNEDKEEKYVPETLLAPINTSDFFNNQEVVIPTQILVNTDLQMDKIEATAAEKIALMNQYRMIVNEYKLPNRINIYGDYENMLAKESKVKKIVK